MPGIYAPLVSTWDLDVADGGPRRPSLADVGGAQAVNATAAPDPTKPNAQRANQHDHQVAALAAVAPLLTVSVHIDGGGTAHIVAFSSPSTRLTLDDLSVVQDGPGDLAVYWPTAKLPPTGVRPGVDLNFDASGVPPAAPAAPLSGYVSDNGGPVALTGARVVTYSAAGALADYDVTVTVR